MITNYCDYFKSLGLDTPEQSYYTKIRTWDSWYRSNVASFHSYHAHLGKGGSILCHRRSLSMAKKLCEDIADFLLNERVSITCGDDVTGEYVKAVLDAANFVSTGNEYQEIKAATGTVAYVPYVYDMYADDDGYVYGGKVGIHYYSAYDIYPTAWNDGKIINVAFVREAKYRGNTYGLVQHHVLEDTGNGKKYVVYSAVVDGGKSVVPRSMWDAIPEFRGIPERVETGSDIPLFAIDKLAIVNNAGEKGNPLGLPIFANSVDTLAKIDIEYDSFANEFLLGRKKIFVAPEMLQDENGNIVFDPHEGLYYMLPEDFFKDHDKAIEESNMTIREKEHEDAINHDLNILSLKSGFGSQYYRFERGSMATATQVISENSDLYRTIRKHELPLGTALKTLVRAIIRLGIVTGAEGLDQMTDIKIDFDDSIIQDKEAERKRDREDVSMGAMGLAEYRAKWYGEPEEVAATRIRQTPAGGTS